MSYKESDINKILGIFKELLIGSQEQDVQKQDVQKQDVQKRDEQCSKEENAKMRDLAEEYERYHEQSVRMVLEEEADEQDETCAVRFMKPGKVPVPHLRIVEALSEQLKATKRAYEEIIKSKDLQFRKRIKLEYHDGQQEIVLNENADPAALSLFDVVKAQAGDKATEYYEVYCKKNYGEGALDFLGRLFRLAINAMFSDTVPPASLYGVSLKGSDHWNELMNFLLKYNYSLDQACSIVADLQEAKEKGLIKLEILTDVEPLVESLKGLKTVVSLNEALSHTSNESVFRRYEDAMYTLSGEAAAGLPFKNCGLTNTHIFLLCEILKTSVAGCYSSLDLTGYQDFDPKYLADQLFDVLSTNPHAVYCLVLPKELEQYEKLKKLWAEITAGWDASRILWFEEASFEPSKGKDKLKI